MQISPIFPSNQPWDSVRTEQEVLGDLFCRAMGPPHYVCVIRRATQTLKFS